MSHSKNRRQRQHSSRSTQIPKDRIATTYLITWDQFDSNLEMFSYALVLHSLAAVKQEYQAIFVRQCESVPGENVNYLPMPRVHCCSGRMAELSEAGYDFILESENTNPPQ